MSKYKVGLFAKYHWKLVTPSDKYDWMKMYFSDKGVYMWGVKYHLVLCVFSNYWKWVPCIMYDQVPSMINCNMLGTTVCQVW